MLEPPRSGVAHLPWSDEEPPGHLRTYSLLFVLVVASRLATTIYYIEDTDSLRFALSVEDYSVAELRPHFPGYPVFSFLAKLLTSLTGSYAIAFSLIGGVAVFGILYYLQRILRLAPDEPRGIILALFVCLNPLFWLLSNRYMPDLLGAAFAMAAMYHLVQGRRDLGFVLAGLLGGIRFSYLPFLLPAVLVGAVGRVPRAAALGAMGGLVWLIPLVLDTGWVELIEAARRQTGGHFAEFGGTIQTETDVGERALGILRGVWAHGLGGYWSLRNPLTIAVGAGVVATLVTGLRPLGRALTHRTASLLVASWATYLLWIFFYQNVIHKSRHVVPLVVLLLMILGFGAWEIARRGWAGKALMALFLASYAGVTIVLVAQHRQPTAIAQLAEHLREVSRDEQLYVVSIPLANYYLASVGVRAIFVASEDAEALASPPQGSRVMAVGSELSWMGPPNGTRIFYHNPFVNPMWPEVVVREYASEPE